MPHADAPHPPLPRGLLPTLAGVVLVLLFARSMTRFLDLDEHQFVAPPLLLLQQGLRPYADYPYFHMPDLVYIYAALMAWVPDKLLAARALSVVAGWLTIVLVFRAGWAACDRYPPRMRLLMVGGACLCYLCSRLFTYTNGWAWNHDTAVLCAVGAFLAHTRGLRHGSVAPIAAAGFLAGLAVGIRLSFALIVVPLAVSLVVGRSPLRPGRRFVALAAAALAATAALLPALVPLVRYPEAFVFGNLEYARLNTVYYTAAGGGLTMTWTGKVLHALRVAFDDPGNAALSILTLYALGYRLWRTRAWRGEFANEVGLSLGLLPVLLIGAWGPTPTQYQYYYMLLPFAVLGSLYVLAGEPPERVADQGVGRAFAAAALVVGLTGLPRWYWNVIDLPFPNRWVPVAVHRTGEWVRANIPPRARVLTVDPIPPLEGGVAVDPAYAVGRFPMHVGPYMTPESRARAGVLWGEALERRLAEQPPDAVFADLRILELIPDFVRYAEAHSFCRLDSPDGAYRLWVPSFRDAPQKR